MTTVVLSDEGQVPLPAELRRRLGLGASAQLELSGEVDGLRLRVLRGTRTVRTTWIVRAGEEFARLTSCYVL